jgi:hypothetical protein
MGVTTLCPQGCVVEAILQIPEFAGRELRVAAQLIPWVVAKVPQQMEIRTLTVGLINIR